ncbi:MAG: rhodanese-like domain-containing protein [bacterium]
MAIEQIRPDKAKEMLDQDHEVIYVDVRSVPEFVRGHPVRALNIPLLHLNENQQMTPNPDFAKVAAAVLPKDKTLIVGCMAGGRSQKACEALAQLGFQNLFNMQGGWGGGRDPMTGEAVAGWAQHGFPANTENGEGVGYESLLAKAK